MKAMHSPEPSSHILGSQRNDSSSAIDYTAAKEGVAVQGHLANGVAIESTARCPKCKRVGVISEEHHGTRIIVHRGFVNGELLEGNDSCEV
jgi:hypothetical protein